MQDSKINKQIHWIFSGERLDIYAVTYYLLALDKGRYYGLLCLLDITNHDLGDAKVRFHEGNFFSDEAIYYFKH